MDLTAFVAARLDEDERFARSASSQHPCPDAYMGRWTPVGRRHVTYDNGCGEHLQAIDVTGKSCLWCEQVWVKGDPDAQVTSHVARHDPERVIRDVAAKRAILAEHEHAPASYAVDSLPGLPPYGCVVCGRNDDGTIAPVGTCTTVRALASAYSDHPDYSTAWK